MTFLISLNVKDRVPKYCFMFELCDAEIELATYPSENVSFIKAFVEVFILGSIDSLINLPNESCSFNSFDIKQIRIKLFTNKYELQTYTIYRFARFAQKNKIYGIPFHAIC